MSRKWTALVDPVTVLPAGLSARPHSSTSDHTLLRADLKILGSPEMAALYAAWLSSGGAPPPSLHAWALLTGQPMTASMEAESLRKSFGGGPCC